MVKRKKKRYINLEEKEYRKRKRDSDTVNALKPLLAKAHKLLRHKKVVNINLKKLKHGK